MCSHFLDRTVTLYYHFLLISFSLSSVFVSFLSLFSLLSHFSFVTPFHPRFFLSLSPSQPTLSPLQFFSFSLPFHSLLCSSSLSPSSVSLKGKPSIAHQNMLPPLFSKPTCSLLIIIITVISILIVRSEYGSSTIRLPSDFCAISIPTCRHRSRALHPLLSFSLSLSCSSSTPSYSFFHFLFVFLFPFLSASQVHGSWVWLGCDVRCGWVAVVFRGL